MVRSPKERARLIHHFIQDFRVKPGSTVKLPDDFDPAYKADLFTKADGANLLAAGVEMLADFQARLAAQDNYGVLVVLQAMDAAGKDGTIRHVMSGVNPQGVKVSSFKVPSAEELDHDYLWRYAKRLPGRGEIGIFNRSHYEEVLVVRVHQELLARQHLPQGEDADGVWKRRYREINNWERYLHDNGFLIVKLFLNVSAKEQRRRLLRRIDDPARNWKFSPADMKERQYWDDYQRAYSQMLSHTSTEWAPWYVIPADRKWFARISAAATIVDTLIRINPQFPHAAPEVLANLDQYRQELVAEQ